MPTLCSKSKLKYAARQVEQGYFKMSKHWSCSCGSSACKSALNLILKEVRWGTPFTVAVTNVLGDIEQMEDAPKPRPATQRAVDPRPKLKDYPPQWDAARRVAGSKWEEVEPFLHCLVAIWAYTGARALRREFKIHDMAGHVIGGAFVGVTGEHLAMVAETMLLRDLGPYEGVLAALKISREQNPAAGNLLPAYTLQRGQTSLRELIEFAEVVDEWRHHFPVAELLAAAAVL